MVNMKLEAKIMGQKVHEVGYRIFLMHRAVELGCRNFSAYNRFEDGCQMVVALVEGDEREITGFRKYASECKPEGAIVSSIDFDEYYNNVMPIDDYLRISTVEQLNKGIPAILRLDKKQDKMLETQDKMLEMQERMLGIEGKMLEIQSKMLEKQDKTIAKLDETRADIVSEIRVSREEVIAKLDENREAIIGEIGEQNMTHDDRFKRIESEISKLKAKVGI